MAKKSPSKKLSEQSKKTKPPKKITDIPKKLTMDEKTKEYNGDLLQGHYDIAHLKRYNLYSRTVRRKARYWCYKISNAIREDRPIPKVPKGWKEFVESLPGFAGWKYFAISWDIWGDNPFMVVLRLQSVWDEWDQVMNRVSIPIDTPPEQIHARIQALADEYARKEAKNK